jgi:hypothetical protein
LQQWADKEERKPLVLGGARQVGKTTQVELFSRNFDVFINLNLEEKKYMIVGGLPEAVRNYTKRKDWVSLNEVFNSLLSGYKDDIEKYAQRAKE